MMYEFDLIITYINFLKHCEYDISLPYSIGSFFVEQGNEICNTVTSHHRKMRKMHKNLLIHHEKQHVKSSRSTPHTCACALASHALRPVVPRHFKLAIFLTYLAIGCDFPLGLHCMGQLVFCKCSVAPLPFSMLVANHTILHGINLSYVWVRGQMYHNSTNTNKRLGMDGRAFLSIQNAHFAALLTKPSFLLLFVVSHHWYLC